MSNEDNNIFKKRANQFKKFVDKNDDKDSTNNNELEPSIDLSEETEKENSNIVDIPDILLMDEEEQVNNDLQDNELLIESEDYNRQETDKNIPLDEENEILNISIPDDEGSFIYDSNNENIKKTKEYISIDNEDNDDNNNFIEIEEESTDEENNFIKIENEDEEESFINVEDNYENIEDNYEEEDNISETQQIDIDEVDNNIMDDLLADAEEILKERNQILEEQVEDIYDEESNISNDNEDSNEGFYDDKEIEEKRNLGAKKPFDKSIIIKVGVGAVFIILAIMIAIGVRNLINKDIKQPVNTTTPTPEPTVDTPDTNESEDEIKGPEIIDDIIGDINDNTDIDTNEPDINEDIITPDDSNTNENQSGMEDTDDSYSVFMQTFKGYVVDINDSDIYVSDLTFDKYNLLMEDFNVYNGSEDLTVYLEEDSKIYHLKTCELYKDTFKETKVSKVSEEYKACDKCLKDLESSTDKKDIKDYDYSKVKELENIIYKKFSFEDTSVIPKWLTIGSEITTTYIQDPDSLLNELIEIKKYTKVEENNGTTINKPSEDKTDDNKNTTTESTSGTNVWGKEWEEVVSKINERNKKELSDNPDSSKNPLDLDDLELRETVTLPIEIGKASIVWFRIQWAANDKAKDVPNIEDVAVELMSSNKSLINDSNINKYGKMWIDNGVINYVIKDTKAGEWNVVFTKDVGTYLGDVQVTALPITGFLQIADASAIYTDGKLKVIWSAGGVKDDNCLVQIYAKNGTKNVLLYSGNSIDDGIHTVDMVEIDTTKIAGNTYDIIIRITDIDVTASKPQTIDQYYVTDSKTIENIEIPAIK